LKHVVLLVSRL